MNEGYNPNFEYEDYAEMFEPTGRQGGGGGKKQKERSGHSKTSKAAREASRENAQANREVEARNRIFSVLKHFPAPDTDPREYDYLDGYQTWLTKALTDDTTLLIPQDIQMEFMRAKTKAGGQNVNKVNSAVRLTHTPTRIQSRSDISRDQLQNRTFAEELLVGRLNEHVADWKIILGEHGHLEPLQVKYFYIASHSSKE